MAKVIVSREARNDLINIQTYIRDELLSPDASKRILGELKKAMISLQDMPERGKPLDSVLSVHTEYRYLVCERYRIFYLSDGDTDSSSKSAALVLITQPNSSSPSIFSSSTFLVSSSLVLLSSFLDTEIPFELI